MKHERWNSRAVLWPCKDCGCEVSPVRDGKRSTWGVSNDVWKEAGMKVGKSHFTGEFLCFDCFIARLGARRGHKLSDMEIMRVWGRGSYSTHMWVSRKQWRRRLRHRNRQVLS